MRFEWDPEKARSNLAKHGLPFALAVATFDDPFQLVVLDDRPYGEERWHCIASLPRGAIISIIFTERSADDGDIIIRVISLRPATSNERVRYRAAAR